MDVVTININMAGNMNCAIDQIVTIKSDFDVFQGIILNADISEDAESKHPLQHAI